MATLAGVGWILAAAVMALLWVWHLKLRNAAIADVGWAFLVGGLAVLYAVLGDGWPPRRAAVAFMMGSWGARLTLYLLYDRVLGRPEDGRHAELRRRRGDGANAWFFWFFEVRAVAAVFFSLPALLAVVNRDEAFSPLELVAAGLWIVAFTGEVTADRQLERFKADAGNRGHAYQGGLWRYSRHPNDFFEWLMWIAYATFASASPGGWTAFLCPAMMTVLLFKLTSAFVPWFRRS